MTAVGKWPAAKAAAEELSEILDRAFLEYLASDKKAADNKKFRQILRMDGNTAQQIIRTCYQAGFNDAFAEKFRRSENDQD